MKKLTPTLFFFAFVATFCSAQWSVGLQYSQDISQNRLFPAERHPTNHNYSSFLLDLHYRNVVYFNNNSTTTLNLNHKKNRWRLGLGLSYQVRDFRIKARINSIDKQQNITYITSHRNSIFRQAMPVSSNSLDDLSYYLQRQRYLGITPSLDFYWRYRPKFKGYIHTNITFSEKYSNANRTELLLTSDLLFTYSIGFGFEQSFGQKMAIQYGLNYQHSSTNFLTKVNISDRRELRFFRPFVQIRYPLF